MKPALFLFSLFAALLFACGGDDAVQAEGADFGGGDGLAQVRPSQHVKAIWVTRFDYVTKADIDAILSNVTDAGFNTVMWQVRGNATALYDSPFEPWAEQLGGVDPGFDPLAYAVEGARARGLSLHAWVNLMPAWWGLAPPTDPAQLYNVRPEWMWYDQFGGRQALSDKFYVSLNPCLPEVRAYLTHVIVDIATRYNVEGIHLDYARLPKEPPATPAGSGLDYPRDLETMRSFQAFLGMDLGAARVLQSGEPDPLAAPGMQKAWDLWRTQNVTTLIEEIAAGLSHLERPPLLSAAVKARPNDGLAFHQDARDWTRRGLVGAVFPMNYTQDLALFTERNAAWRAELDEQASYNISPPIGVVDPTPMPRTPVLIVGVQGANDDPAVTRQLIERALEQGAGFCLFAYSNWFDSTNEAIDTQDAAESAKRKVRRQALMPFVRAL